MTHPLHHAHKRTRNTVMWGYRPQPWYLRFEPPFWIVASGLIMCVIAAGL